MGQLTTHVLDINTGRPAAGLAIELWQMSNMPTRLKVMVTNRDGRGDEPLLKGDELTPGIYELRFHAGDYLKKSEKSLSSPPFLDLIPIRFGIADASQHYHVPLLLSAHGYSTYRGS